MNTSESKQHYDSSLEYNITMYDNMPYMRDEHLCGADKVALSSGNVIKCYAYKCDSTCMINNQDDKTKAYVLQREQEILKRIQAEHDEYVNDAIQEALTKPDENET